MSKTLAQIAELLVSEFAHPEEGPMIQLTPAVRGYSQLTLEDVRELRHVLEDWEFSARVRKALREQADTREPYIAPTMKKKEPRSR